VGTQYRSAIFYHSEEQRRIAEKSKQETDASGLWSRPIVTVIEPLTHFYPGEGYHQDFYRSNPYQPYCLFVIDPKMQKFRKEFQHRLRDTAEA
jgi:peptide-methionine (S)-S-oxide reductase